MKVNILALDIGGTKIAGALLDIPPGESPRLLFTDTIPTQASQGGLEVAKRVADFAKKLQVKAEKLGYRPQAVSIASAGVVDTKTGKIISATELMPTWGGVELGSYISEHLHLAVTVLNDVHAHALGEVIWGAGAGVDSALVITVGTGIGGAVIYNGKVITGAHYAAGHLGHTAYQEGPQLDCSCGSRGHIEAIASGSGLAHLYNHLLAENNKDLKTLPLASGLAVSQRIHEDKIAAQAIKISARALGQALGNLANSFDPERIIVSGAMAENGRIWWQSLREGYSFSALPILGQTPILKGSLGTSAALLGAAAFYLDSAEPTRSNLIALDSL